MPTQRDDSWTLDDASFVDESGWTSMEPEGPGHHPHVWSDFPDIASEDRWDDDFGGQAGGEPAGERTGRTGGERGIEYGAGNARGMEGMAGGGESHTRGPEPVEGDGWGRPG